MNKYSKMHQNNDEQSINDTPILYINFGWLIDASFRYQSYDHEIDVINVF